MGIKGLWTVLTPYSEKKSLHEIRGQTVAVDLSGWVCDSQNVTEYHIQPKLYLRNLFFRAIYLLLADINPIFVLEGDAPELKRDVMAARNAIQFRGAAPRSEMGQNKLPAVTRKRFKCVQKECESLLKCMGMRCIKGRGEAEATCAALNAQGLVDAVISQDSDCFAYGARRVYRNFSVSNAAGGGALQGSVDCYDAAHMYESNGFGRNKMVALALLCGCDYGVGACGSMITTAVQFLHTVPETEIISRLLSWVTDPEYYEKQARWASAPALCDRCGHVGRTHLRNGCPVCGTHRGCNDLAHKSKVAEVKRELSLRSRAVSCGEPFPEPKVVNEFLNSTEEEINIDSLKGPVPSLIQFVKLMTHKLDWSERYCVEKFLPILTKWHLQDQVACRTIEPVLIKKKRNPRGVPSYEVVWGDIDGQYAELIPDDQFEEGDDPTKAWTSTERQDLMRQHYPKLVEAFEQSIKKPPKEKKSRAKKTKEANNIDKPKRKYNRKVKNYVDMDNFNESMKKLIPSELNTSKNLNVSVSVNKLKRKIKHTKKGSQKTIDSFMAKKRKSLKKSLHSLRCSFKNISVNDDDDCKFMDNKENKENNFLNMLNKTEDETQEYDISDIIDKIVARPPVTKTAKVDNKLVNLVFDQYSTPKKFNLRKSILNNNHCSTPKDSPIRKASFNFKFSTNSFNNLLDSKVDNSLDSKVNNSLDSKVNTSHFFDKLTEDRDAFEMSLEYKHKSAIIIDCDTTVIYSLPDVCL